MFKYLFALVGLALLPSVTHANTSNGLCDLNYTPQSFGALITQAQTNGTDPAHVLDIPVAQVTNVPTGADVMICLTGASYPVPGGLVIPGNVMLTGPVQTGYTTIPTFMLPAQNNCVHLSSNDSLENVDVVGAAINNTGATTTCGIFVNNADSVQITNVTVTYVNTALQILTSGNVTVTNLLAYFNGHGVGQPHGPTTEVNVYVSDSWNVTINGSTLQGSNNGPSGDGDIAVYESFNVVINGLDMENSGADGIFMVHCIYCTVENSTFAGSNEFGIDLQCGDYAANITGNTVENSYAAAMLLDSRWYLGPSITNNGLLGNYENWGSCTGLNVNSMSQGGFDYGYPRYQGVQFTVSSNHGPSDNECNYAELNIPTNCPYTIFPSESLYPFYAPAIPSVPVYTPPVTLPSSVIQNLLVRNYQILNNG